MTQFFALYGKAGLNYYTLEYSYNNQTKDKSTIGGEFGFGFEIRLGALGLNLGYDYIKNEYIQSNVIAFGANIHF